MFTLELCCSRLIVRSWFIDASRARSTPPWQSSRLLLPTVERPGADPCSSQRSETGVCSERWSRGIATFSWASNRLRFVRAWDHLRSKLYLIRGGGFSISSEARHSRVRSKMTCWSGTAGIRHRFRSGIFLVEDVPEARTASGRAARPTAPTVRCEDPPQQIAGLDIDPEAVRLAAFSLYLALLHYHEPRDIFRRRCRPTDDRDRQTVQVALRRSCRIRRLQPRGRDYRRRVRAISVRPRPISSSETHPGVTRKVRTPSSPLARRRPNRLVRQKPGHWRPGVSSVVHRTLDILRDGGRAGLLLSTGVFFKRHETSRTFRRQWLEAVALEHVVNFAAVRDTFFSGPSHKEGSIAPFASVVFEKKRAAANQRFAYWSAKKTAFIKHVQVVILSRADVRIVRQNSMLTDDELWKVYWWGSHRNGADRKRFASIRLFEMWSGPTPRSRSSSVRALVKRERKRSQAIGCSNSRSSLPNTSSATAQLMLLRTSAPLTK